MSGMEILTLGSALPTGCQLLTAHSKAILVQKTAVSTFIRAKKIRIRHVIYTEH